MIAHVICTCCRFCCPTTSRSDSHCSHFKSPLPPRLMDGLSFLRFLRIFFLSMRENISIPSLSPASHQRMCWEAHTRGEGKETERPSSNPSIPTSQNAAPSLPPSSLERRFRPTAALGGSWRTLLLNLPSSSSLHRQLLSHCKAAASLLPRPDHPPHPHPKHKLL